jgi:hypothetical protein
MPADRSSRKGQPASRQARRKEPPPQVGTRDEDTVYLQDPRDIRALAHPARMAIIDALASGDELTATEREEPEEWQDIASLANADLWLTAEETRKVTADLAAVLETYRGRALADRPDGARRVRIMNMVSPHRRR